jgi:membrane protein
MRVLDPDRLPGLLLETARRMGNNRIIEMSAALAFYAALSLAPLVIIVLGVAGVVIDRDRLETYMADEANRVLGHGAGDLVRQVAAEQHSSGTGTLATIVGVVALMLAATAVFGQLKDGLDRIWDVKRPAHTRLVLWSFAKKKLLSVAMVASVGFLLLVSMLVSAGFSLVTKRTVIDEDASSWGLAAHIAASVLVSMLLFTVVFRVLPDTRVDWVEAWGGGVLTAVLFHLGEWGIGQYLGRASVGSAYGAAGTLLVLLVWVYYSSVIVFAGAQFTQVWALKRGRARAPRAVRPPQGGLPE